MRGDADYSGQAGKFKTTIGTELRQLKSKTPAPARRSDNKCFKRFTSG
jgi:hypothetical protein